MKNAPPRYREIFTDPTVPELDNQQPRSNRRHPLILVAGIAALLMLFSILAESLLANASPPVAGKQRDAFFPLTADLAANLKEARSSGRQGIAVLFEMDGCGECAKLRATTFKDSTLRSAFERDFVTVSLLADHPLPLRDFDGQTTLQTEFARSQRIFALPTLVFYDLDGLPVARHLGSAGDAAEWIRLARYVREKGYEEAPFEHWQGAD